MNLFLSYKFDDEAWVQRVSFYLKNQAGLETFLYSDERRAPDEWRKTLNKAIDACDVFVLFKGPELGKTQRLEAMHMEKPDAGPLKWIVVELPGAADAPMAGLPKLQASNPLRVSIPTSPFIPESDRGAYACASEIAGHLLGRDPKGQPVGWVPYDGLPIGYPFDYEKDVIDIYTEGYLPGMHIGELGCSPSWPHVRKNAGGTDRENPVPESVTGKHRDDGAQVLVDARVKKRSRALTLPEAGPRKRVRYPRGNAREVKVAILVSGGIAPGINAVIAGIMQRHKEYERHYGEKCRSRRDAYKVSVSGVRDGFYGLLRTPAAIVDLNEEEVARYTQAGGSMLGTSRARELSAALPPAERARNLTRAVRAILKAGIEILYIIGGDGTMRAAHALWETFSQMERDNDVDAAGRELSVVAIPKTMDNDILWVWQSFGFLTAVQTATNFLNQLQTEVRSNPRLCIVQLFGSDSGFVVGQAALASELCDYVLAPEVEFTTLELRQHMRDRLNDRYSPGGRITSPYGLIVTAETAIPTDWRDYIADPDAASPDDEIHAALTEKEILDIEQFELHERRVHGQTPDGLRRGGLKIVSAAIQRELREMAKLDDYWNEFRVVANEPRHLIRAVPPSASDVIFARRLGTLAVDNAMAGYTDCMVSHWLTEYVLVPLELVVLGRKRVPEDGIFWKSVVAKTGQPTRERPEV